MRGTLLAGRVRGTLRRGSVRGTPRAGIVRGLRGVLYTGRVRDTQETGTVTGTLQTREREAHCKEFALRGSRSNGHSSLLLDRRRHLFCAWSRAVRLQMNIEQEYLLLIFMPAILIWRS